MLEKDFRKGEEGEAASSGIHITTDVEAVVANSPSARKEKASVNGSQAIPPSSSIAATLMEAAPAAASAEHPPAQKLQSNATSSELPSAGSRWASRRFRARARASAFKSV